MEISEFNKFIIIEGAALALCGCIILMVERGAWVADFMLLFGVGLAIIGMIRGATETPTEIKVEEVVDFDDCSKD